MKTFINENIEIKGMSEDKYDLLIEFLEENNIDYKETEYEEYTVDDRSEDEKYDEWLWTLADSQYEERKLGLD